MSLSVTNFDLNYLQTGKIEWAEITSSKKFAGLGARAVLIGPVLPNSFQERFASLAAWAIFGSLFLPFLTKKSTFTK